MQERDLLEIGKVVKARGLRGWVKVFSYADSPETFRQAREVYASVPTRGTITLGIQKVETHKRSVFLKFKGKDRVEDIEDLVGVSLFLDKEDLPPLEKDEYYWYQLIGMEVRTDTGRQLGTLEQVLETGSNDVYVVRLGDDETLVPAIREVILNVDVPGKQMIVRPMEQVVDEHDL